jgi:ABC-type polysaccharide/polyol phosphate transport system ATPase subunit
MKIEARNLGKRFRRGERLTTLRDAVWSSLPGSGQRRTRERGEFWALRGTSFTLERGECLGVIGMNGAGKSTLLKLISSILRADEGTIEVRGRVTPLIEAGAGFHLDLTGMENILLNAAILGCSLRKARAAVDDIVAFAELEEFIHTPVKRYSSGMYRRLGFSVAAHLEPDILLVDELLSVGDYLFAERCLQRMGELRDRGVTMVFVSHNLHQVRLFCDRALWLHRGEPAALGAVDDVVARYVEEGEFEASRLDIGAVPSRVRFVDAAILAPDGTRVDRIETGGALTVELALEAPAPLPRVGVVLAIETIQGTPVFGASTFADRGPVTIPPGRHCLRCRFPSVPLMPGPYQVRAAVVDESMSATVVPWQAVGHLGVRAGTGGLGYRSDHVPVDSRNPYPCHVEHEWRWSAPGSGVAAGEDV